MKKRDEKLLFVGDVIMYLFISEEAALLCHIIDISPDKPGWWMITFRNLTTGDTWHNLLDDDHIRQEVFQMGGKDRQLVLLSRATLPEAEQKVVENITTQTITEEDALF